MPGDRERSKYWRRLLYLCVVLTGMAAATVLVAACSASQPAAEPTKASSAAPPSTAPAAPAKAPATAAPAAQPTAAPKAEAWLPKSDVTFIVPMAPGGAQDPISRMLAQESEPLLKQKVVVVNREGAASTVGTAEVVQAKTDGLKIGLSTAAAIAWEPQVTKLPYGGVKDMQPIIKLAEVPATMAVVPNAPWKNIKDFVEDARKNPGKYSVTASGRYSGTDLPLWHLKLVTGIDFNNVPAGSGAEAITRVMGGHTNIGTSTPVNINPQVKAGKLRVLTVFQKDRHYFFPDVPTTVEMGYNVTLPLVYFVAGPKGLDKPILDSYYNIFSQVIKSAKFRQFAEDSGYSLDPIGPAELTKELTEWEKIYGDLIRELKIEIKK